MKFLKLKTYWFIALLAVGYFALSSCQTSSIILKTAPSSPAERIALPEIIASSTADWESQKDGFDKALQRDVYGTLPPLASIKSVDKRTLNANVYKGQARAENWTITIDIPREDGKISTAQFDMAVILPKSDSPVPIVSMQTFCPTNSTLPKLGIQSNSGSMCEGDGFGANLMLYVFGRHISTPPIEDILARGYAIAAMYPSGIIPDHPQAGRAAVTRLFGESSLGPNHNTAVIGGWAYIWTAAAEAMANDPDIDSTRIATFGHSRYGKSALLTGVWSDHISAIISHQSGTGGASLSRGKKGESVTQIMRGYPHWFAPAYAKYDTNAALDVEQHHLLALLAPRPILIGNARRDVWSDPEGAFHAARAADKIYELYGKDGLTVEKLNKFDPKAELSFWLRRGTHGIVKEDWPAFLDFLDAHFKK